MLNNPLKIGACIILQTVEKQKNDLLVRFHAGGCLEMSWHLYTWCDQVKVLKPADFWQRVQKAREEWF